MCQPERDAARSSACDGHEARRGKAKPRRISARGLPLLLARGTLLAHTHPPLPLDAVSYLRRVHTRRTTSASRSTKRPGQPSLASGEGGGGAKKGRSQQRRTSGRRAQPTEARPGNAASTREILRPWIRAGYENGSRLKEGSDDGKAQRAAAPADSRPPAGVPKSPGQGLVEYPRFQAHRVAPGRLGSPTGSITEC